MGFEWDDSKNQANIAKHNLSFYEAQEAFFDKNRILMKDVLHSSKETRYFCIGKTSNGIATVRFTLRKSQIRIIGAGYWRKGKKIYDSNN